MDARGARRRVAREPWSLRRSLSGLTPATALESSWASCGPSQSFRSRPSTRPSSVSAGCSARARARRSRRRCSPTCSPRCGTCAGLDAIVVVTGDRVADAAARGERVQVLRDDDQAGQSPAALIGIRYALAAASTACCSCPATRRCSTRSRSTGCSTTRAARPRRDGRPRPPRHRHERAPPLAAGRDRAELRPGQPSSATAAAARAAVPARHGRSRGADHRRGHARRPGRAVPAARDPARPRADDARRARAARIARASGAKAAASA